MSQDKQVNKGLSNKGFLRGTNFPFQTWTSFHRRSLQIELPLYSLRKVNRMNLGVSGTSGALDLQPLKFK